MHPDPESAAAETETIKTENKETVENRVDADMISFHGYTEKKNVDDTV
ncbi:hypothetical protein BWQ96_07783 [Gracilariopsis chorda]|uniref:Uncharacterized protein n=1 Tax=Gracilariopsis chorda TaxID=448386 RepID=A0A2V3IKD0_9FLOR|nr:hypothetical protein BWQ96_07783 [Gracilariopsis chorda]|eukprot:PXF42521.1 hypothetical protein BWQ96_07783 [Gracilariopsis chorda]